MGKRAAAITGSIVGSCVLVVALGTAAVPAAGGCSTHPCDGESVPF